MVAVSRRVRDFSGVSGMVHRTGWYGRPYRVVRRRSTARTLSVQRAEDRVSHLAGAEAVTALVDEVRGAGAALDDRVHRGFHRGRFGLEAERMPQQQRSAQDGADGIR